jgi:hypothetical protein
MLLMMLAYAMTLPRSNADAALSVCRPELARKAGGEIASIALDSSRPQRNGVTIGGRLTAFQGMGPPQPGYASAHHLIRADFTFKCRVVRGRVSDASVSPRQ